MQAEVALLHRMRDAIAAGQLLDAGDAAKAVARLDRAIAGAGLDKGFGLTPGWAARERRRERDQAIACLSVAGDSVREQLRTLSRYARRYFPGDRRCGRARNAEHDDLFAILMLCDGRVPSLTKFQELKTAT